VPHVGPPRRSGERLVPAGHEPRPHGPGGQAQQRDSEWRRRRPPPRRAGLGAAAQPDRGAAGGVELARRQHRRRADGQAEGAGPPGRRRLPAQDVAHLPGQHGGGGRRRRQRLPAHVQRWHVVQLHQLRRIPLNHTGKRGRRLPAPRQALCHVTFSSPRSGTYVGMDAKRHRPAARSSTRTCTTAEPFPSAARMS